MGQMEEEEEVWYMSEIVECIHRLYGKRRDIMDW